MSESDRVSVMYTFKTVLGATLTIGNKIPQEDREEFT